MTDTTSTHRISEEAITVHYVAICKQIKAVDDLIRNQHNRLTTTTDRESLEVLDTLEAAWRLRRQLCEDLPQAEEAFRKQRSFGDTADITLKRVEQLYR